MISNSNRHRKFIGLSFTNTAFAFTRRTCLAAAKTILHEALVASDDAAPVLWIEQAFSVAAGIILSLDMLHRNPADREFGEYKQLIAKTIAYLERFEHNKIATRGVQLLASLQERVTNGISADSRKRRHTGVGGGLDEEWPPRKRTRGVDMQSVIRDISQNLGVTSPATTSIRTPTPSRSMYTSAANMTSDWHALVDLPPDQLGFDSQYLFDNFFPE